MSLHSYALKIVNNRWFQNLSLTLIIFSAVVLGFETSPSIMENYAAALHNIDRVILFAFTIELLIRIVAVGKNPFKFFHDPWNTFDFLIVVVCFLPLNSQFASVARLVRVFRALRLLKAIPQLRLIVSALINSVSSMGYVGMLMFLVFYIYAIVGVFKFGAISPENFGSLGKALFSLFQVVTLEGWVELLEPLNKEYPIGATIYFISFIVFGTLIVLNLFIGVIVNGMDEEKLSQKNELNSDAEDVIAQIDKIKVALEKLESKLKGSS